MRMNLFIHTCIHSFNRSSISAAYMKLFTLTCQSKPAIGALLLLVFGAPCWLVQPADRLPAKIAYIGYYRLLTVHTEMFLNNVLVIMYQEITTGIIK